MKVTQLEHAFQPGEAITTTREASFGGDNDEFVAKITQPRYARTSKAP
ncbi:MAG: hypothetical protein ACREUZ_09980 [Burkholderiales bacterium]